MGRRTKAGEAHARKMREARKVQKLKRDKENREEIVEPDSEPRVDPEFGLESESRDPPELGVESEFRVEPEIVNEPKPGPRTRKQSLNSREGICDQDTFELVEKPVISTPFKDTSNLISDSPGCAHIKKKRRRLSGQFQPLRPLQPKLLTGRRIFSVTSLNAFIIEVSAHSMICKLGPISFIDEKRSGLDTQLHYICGCGKCFHVESNSEDLSLKANEGLTWGCQVAATGFVAASTLLTTLEIPGPSYGTYRRQQDIFQQQVLDAMRKNMKEWAMKEVQMATEAGDFVNIEGINYPSILVILDGGWSKRSYGHTYASNCGIAVIIGSRTGKVIYTDVKIRTCLTCDRKRSNEIPPHECSKNWAGPPTAMESAILLEGFQRSIQDYGLVYSRFIGDGDSSVYAKIKNVYTGIEVKKIECKNHAVKNYTAKLMDIAHNRVRGNDAPKISTDERRFINPKLIRFRVALRQAINYNNGNSGSWKDLRHDILNIPKHIFGEHSECRGYYQCNKKEINMMLQASRMKFFGPLMRATERVAGMATSLIENQTSNRAESFMAVASKYTEGKRKNFGQRGLYKIRMAGAVLSYNESLFWANEAFKLINNQESHSNLWSKRSTQETRRRQIKSTYRVKKPLLFPQLSDRRGDLDYGSNPETPDADNEQLSYEINALRERLQVTPNQASEIELTTKGQSSNPEWFRQRYGRITASFAPLAFKLKDTTNNKSVLDDYFKRKRKMKSAETAIKHGKDNEPRAVYAYEKHRKFAPGTVKDAGLFVYEQNGIFGASPDGLVGDDGIIEVKCPHSLYTKGDVPLHPSEWPKISSSASFTVKKDGSRELKPSHDHYRQIVSQLHITNRSWCDYVIWSEAGILVFTVKRSPETLSLWTDMLNKLTRFWLHELAPEIVDSRVERGYKYRSPPWRTNVKKSTESTEIDSK